MRHWTPANDHLRVVVVAFELWDQTDHTFKNLNPMASSKIRELIFQDAFIFE